MRPAAEWETCGRAQRRGRETRAERETTWAAGHCPLRYNVEAEVANALDSFLRTALILQEDAEAAARVIEVCREMSRTPPAA
jgi:hypothetical protein